MKKTLISIATMIVSFCLVFTSLPLMAGSLDAHAMAKKKAKAAKKITLQASATGQTTVSLKWNKIKKPDKGYAVFRDGKPIAHLGKKATSYTDSNLTAGTGYKYQIKTYKSKKVKQWYNKRTGKWQKKKPAKKYRGPSKKMPVYTYKKKSNIVVAATRPAPVKPSSQNKPGSTDTPSSPGTKPDTAGTYYTYDMRFLNQPYGHGGYTVIYLETDNPYYYNWDIYLMSASGQSYKLNQIERIKTKGKYSDLDLTSYNTGNVNKYIIKVSPEYVGECTFAIKEYQEDTGTAVHPKK